MIRLSRCVFTLTLLAASAFLACAANARSSREAKWDDVAQGRALGPPVLAVVAIKEQRITIYDADGPILRAPISSGQTGLETPVGVFSILQKEAEHYSNRYDDASMPFMERIFITSSPPRIRPLTRRAPVTRSPASPMR